jgi:hypothetical protein
MKYRPILNTSVPYYWVQADIGSFLSNEITKEEVDIRKWLDETPGGEYSLGGTGIYFYRQEDASFFTLRWT